MFGGYDSWKTATPSQYDDGTPASPGCCVCGRGDEPPCSPECMRVAAVRQAQRHLAAARQARGLLARYVAEGDGLESPRVVATLARIGELRADAKTALRRARRVA